LLRLQKEIAVFSPNWIELNNDLHIQFKDQAKRIHCFSIEETDDNSNTIGKGASIWRYLKLSRRLHQAEVSMGQKIDLVFFAPMDDWIKPNFGKKLFDWCFPFKWTGILTQMQAYDLDGLKLNVDPKYGEADYLLSSKNCLGVCTLDRFKSEALKSRVYKKVVVVPDVTVLSEPDFPQKLNENVRKLAKGRMVIGTLLLDGENPENFLELACLAPSDQYFFVYAGKLKTEHLSDVAKQYLQKLLSSNKNNYYLIFHELEGDWAVNDLLKAFDLLYLNDGNYQMPHSMLSKAAHFNKPVLASKNDMIGKLVSTFKTGITVNGEISESLSALSALRLQMPFETSFDLGKFRNYSQLQSPEALREAWEMILLF
jgi:hypothetical protein